MRVQAFADRRPDRVAWNDRQSWEWPALRPENGFFDMPTYVDLYAREKWFFQATFESPAMFRRKAGGGSLYWLGARDATGAYLDGGQTYTLTMPQPVPAKLFWSVTVYDSESRSQIVTDQGKAALRSLFELKDNAAEATVDLHFGPEAPAGKEGQWIKTIPGKGWFGYALWRMMVHLVEHQTYHRGQVTALLRQLGVEPPEVDFLDAQDAGFRA
jgi:hypothetical protein